ncbi:MAG: hypothetical protein E7E64_16055 [Clostridium celatum]|nr:hypothetical protein [Clostridium celatum]MDU4980841.1 hypothetical protein [Clostridium celatum]
MNNNSPSLIINKLVLVGQRKNYIVPFHKGLNVIYGDSDTGKSSILNLINYCLGGNKVHMYDELEYGGKYCLLEVLLNEKAYTIKRDIFAPTQFIEVYHSDIENMNSVFPYEYGPSYSKEGPAGYFSDFLLQALEIPLIRVKKAPSKVDSEFVRLSFRDIFKFCYLDQDEVGSKYVLDLQSGSIFVKNKETFKFIHNILDSQITELQNDLSDKERSKRNLQNKYEVITLFLRETQLKPMTMLKDELVEIDSHLDVINAEISELNTKMTSNTVYNNELREQIQKFKNSIINLNNSQKQIELNIEQNIKLKKEYDKDINKLQSAVEVKSKLPANMIKEADCPICHKKMNIRDLKSCLGDNSAEYLKEEINALKRRKQSLANLIDVQVNEISLIESKKELLVEDLNKAEILLDTNTKDFISPFISQRDGLISQKSSLSEQKSKITYFLKLRNQLDLISDDIEDLQKQIEGLKIKINELKTNSPSASEIVSILGDYLKDFLDFVKIKNAINIGISAEKFLPIVRNKNYSELTSGGLRTLTSVGYFISLLINSIEYNTNLPSFLMIDTIGKYLGKTKDKYLSETNKSHDAKEGISDPDKYLNIYKYLIYLCTNKEKTQEGVNFQIIIVDNEIPLEIEKLVASYTVKRFSTEERKGYDIGFIDDAIS